MHTIQDALSYLSHPQTVRITLPRSQSQAQTAPHANIHQQQPQLQTVNAQPQMINPQQQVLIEALPPVSVIHTKRFCYDKESGGVVKMGTRG